MPDNLIRILVLLLVPVLLVYAMLVAMWLALVEVARDLNDALRNPQSTRFNHWKFWR
jgi:hypothetical protein